MSDLFWLTNSRMDRLQRFFPRSHGKRGVFLPPKGEGVMNALAASGCTSPQRMSAEEVGRNIGSALHAGLAIAQGDNRDLDVQRQRLKLGAQVIMQVWRDLDVLEI